MPEISFRIHEQDADLIHQIVDRAMVALGALSSATSSIRMELSMDLTTCHANGTPLRLAELLAADDANFAHDVFGIHRHINRETGQLEDCFLPRFAVPKNTNTNTATRRTVTTAALLLALALLVGEGAIAHAQQPAAPAACKVNVNQATPEQVKLLIRTGDVLAGRIIEARPLTAEKLDAVKGVGEAWLRYNEPHVVFEGETTCTAKLKAPKDAAPTSTQ